MGFKKFGFALSAFGCQFLMEDDLEYKLSIFGCQFLMEESDDFKLFHELCIVISTVHFKFEVSIPTINLGSP